MIWPRPILKNYQNTYQPRFGFIPKTDVAFPKRGFCFYCEGCDLGFVFQTMQVNFIKRIQSMDGFVQGTTTVKTILVSLNLERVMNKSSHLIKRPPLITSSIHRHVYKPRGWWLRWSSVQVMRLMYKELLSKTKKNWNKNLVSKEFSNSRCIVINI